MNLSTRYGVAHKHSVARFHTLERAIADSKYWETLGYSYPVVYRRWYQRKWRIYNG